MLEFIIILLPAIYFYVHQFFYELEIPHVMLCNLPFLNMHIFATLTMSVLLSVVPCAILYNKKLVTTEEQTIILWTTNPIRLTK